MLPITTRDIRPLGPAAARFENAVKLQMTKGKTRGQAIRAVAHETPAIHEAWLKEINHV